MKHILCAACIWAGLCGCVSIDTSTLPSGDVSANGEAIAVVQATSVGMTALFNIIPVVESDLDVVTQELIREAKAMGASRIQITNAVTTPRRGIFRLLMTTPSTSPTLVPMINVINFPVSTATAIILK